MAVLVALSTVLGMKEASAQAVPPTVEPGRIEERFEAPKKPRSVIEPVVPPAERALPPGEAGKIRFALAGVVVEGSTVYKDSDFLRFYEHHLGKEISLADVYGIAAAITAKYRNDGYILSQVIVPPQHIRGGIVRLRVIEGFINQVIIKGEILGSSALLRSYAGKIERSRPLRVGELEHYLLLANDLPGVSVRSVLVPSETQPGASDLILEVTQDNFDGFVSFDNRGTEFIGPHQLYYGLAFNSAFGLFERTDLRFIHALPPKELRFGQLMHEIPLGAEGTKAIFSVNHSRSEPGDDLKPLEFENRNTAVSLTLIQPFIRSRTQNLLMRAGITARRSESEILGERLTEDRLRIATFGFTYDFADRLRGVTLLDVGLSQGLDIFGETKTGSPNPSRENGKSDFTKVTAELSRLQHLFSELSLFMSFQGQYGGSQLLASEEFGVGGGQFGRAYDPSEIVGDHGIALKAELRLDQPFGLRAARGVQLYAFYDFGAVWNRATSGGGRRESLASAGGGVRLNITDMISGHLEIAVPLTRGVAARGGDGDDPRLFFGVVMRF